MLSSLHIKNIALIEDIEINLTDGLNILSGETGAGKSIIIDSLNFVLGERADKSLIRYGEEKAQVEAVFEASDVIASEIFEMLDIEHEDNTVIIKRSMTTLGKNEIRVNGVAVTRQMLKSLSEKLCDIHGQHEHQSLLRVDKHLELLDKYDRAVEPLVREVNRYYNELKECKRALSTFGDPEERSRRIEYLKYQISEITSADVKEGEEDEIIAIRKRLQNAGKIAEGLSYSVGFISENGEGYNAVSDLNRAVNYLNHVSRYDGRVDSLTERLEATVIELQDISDTLQEYIKESDYNPAYADSIESRFDLIRGLKRKYACTDASELLSTLDKLTEELNVLTDSDSEIERLTGECQRLTTKLYASAKALSLKRRSQAEDLENAIIAELNDLGMRGTTFSVSFNDMPSANDFLDYCTGLGFDEVEFLISPNVGEPLKPLAKIISGGEMSRFMLAIKHILSRIDDIGTLVFDEIDTGISGRIAEVVSIKLFGISRHSQVIAVTHLPQLASFADTNVLIQKSVVGSKTVTSLIPLDYEGKVIEISRLSGAVGESGIIHAKEMIRHADDIKSNH